MILRQWLQVVFLSLLVAGSGWLLYLLGKPSSDPDDTLRHDPDFYMKDFITVVMDEGGTPKRELRGERARHYPDTDTNELLRPHLVIYRNGSQPLQLTAESGWVSADGDVVLLQGRVNIWRNDEDGVKQQDVVTRDVRLLPDAGYAETDKPVLIQMSSTEIRSIGMKAYLDENRVELLSQVRTYYETKQTD